MFVEDGIEVKNGYGYSRLFVKRLEIYNSGTYTCVAQNRIGRADSKTEVLVFGKCSQWCCLVLALHTQTFLVLGHVCSARVSTRVRQVTM